MNDDIPRRARLDHCTPAELAIYAAMEAVEALPADVRLTDAGSLLQAARHKVADYVDGVGGSRLPGPREALIAKWRKEAAALRGSSYAESASQLEDCADELERGDRC